LGAGDGLGHVAARARADHGDHVLGGVGYRQRQEAGVCGGALDHLDAAAVRHVHVEEDDVGLGRLDLGHRLVDGRGVAHELDEVLELRANAGAEELVVIHDQYARHSSLSSTSVPSGELFTVARPPWRSIRPTIDSRMPRRSSGTALGSKPGPRSRTKTLIAPSLAS